MNTDFEGLNQKLLNQVGTLSGPIYLTRKDGEFHWYTKDPMHTSDREVHEVSIEEYLTEKYGISSIKNPIIVEVKAFFCNRATSFTISELNSIQSGAPKHVEDSNNHIVKILPGASSSPQFPLRGELYDFDGTPCGTGKNYSFKGECEDGNPDHNLVIVNGTISF